MFYFCTIMKARKVIWSVVLLLTYSLGFAHYLIPHSHTEGEGHDHAHHQHLDIDNHNEDEFHIHHDDHVDPSVYDLLICLVSEMEHPEDNCAKDHSELTYTFLPTQKIETPIPLISALYAVVINGFPEVAESVSSSYEVPHYEPPSLIHTSLRGPPVLA